MISHYQISTFGLNSLREMTNAPCSFVFIESRAGARMINGNTPNLRLVESEWDNHASFEFLENLPTSYQFSGYSSDIDGSHSSSDSIALLFRKVHVTIKT